MEAAGVATASAFEEVECAYSETMGELHDLLESITSPANTSLTQSFVQTQVVAQPVPRIRIPPFEGNFLQWYPFKDLFNSTVTSNASLTNTQRLQYLKDSLSGDAKTALDHITTTDSNFQVAWELLQSKYENKRVIINAHLATISKLPIIPKESASALRALLDGVTASIRALKNLGRPIEHWDDWLVFTITNKLDANTRKAWELSLKSNDNIPTFKELQAFLTSRTQSLEIVQNFTEVKPSAKEHIPKKVGTSAGISRFHVASGRCPNCAGKHILMFCEAFRNKAPHERYSYALQAKLCINCLHGGHQQSTCSSEHRCKTCQAKHHTMLHDYFAINASSTNKQGVASHNAVSKGDCGSILPPVLIGTALIEVRTECGHIVVLRALLDSGAEATFISESAVNLLHLVKSNVSVPINGATGGRVTTAKGLVRFTVRSLKSDFELDCIALVLPRVGNCTPSVPIASNDAHDFNALDLADPTWNAPQPIDVILNAGDYAAVLLNGIQRSGNSNLIEQSTRLGWVIFGSSATSNSPITMRDAVDCYHTQLDLDRTLRRFWEIEEVSSASSLTQEDRFVEDYFNSTTHRAADGRYIVRLPVKPDADLSQLASTQHDATVLLDHLKRRLSRDPVMRHMYEQFMAEYAELHHMVPISGEESDGRPICYLPHHGVWKGSSSTTKLRVVFNASRRYNKGKSLNDCLCSGPKLQNDLTSILLNWRRYRVALTGDIAKMYRQILVDDRDTDPQRIVWRSKPQPEPTHFRLKTVTYGMNCAPYLAIKVLQTLAADEGARYPDAAQILLNEFYVDDVLTGADNVIDACKRREELQGLLQAGGFALRKWNSNSNQVLQSIDPSHVEPKSSHQLQLEGEYNTLGLMWAVNDDCLTYALKLDYTITTYTKRQLLSDVAKLFDPLGFLAPLIIRGKIFIQNLWLTGLGWNDSLPEDLRIKWISFRNELKAVPEIRISRWLNTDQRTKTYELHTFADASANAYAAVVYLKVVTQTSVHVHLLMSKTRVAPLKKVTIPRLELCAAVLAARLMKHVRDTLKLGPIVPYMWSDSTTTIWWIRSEPGALKEFVANRVSQIQAITNVSDWRYVNTKDKPADCASRGLTINQLLGHHLWWHGPSWLQHAEANWPKIVLKAPENNPEYKPVQAMTTHTTPSDIFILENYSTLEKLLSVTAWCFRFIHSLQGRPIAKAKNCLWKECEAALRFWIKRVQAMAFKNDISSLKDTNTVQKRSKLLRLRPMVDSDEIVRVGGRLNNANISYSERHPVILPKDSHLTTLVIRQAHQRTLHGGTQATLHFIRQRYWVIDGRRTVKRTTNNCVRCFRYRCLPQTQIMGDLPPARCNVSSPFMKSGLDFAGPFHIRTTKGRGHRTLKGYVALFVCLSTRAIHLELVSDMTTDTFLAALSRFASTRGLCSDLYSDQGTTFIGANNLIREEINSFKAQLQAGAAYGSTVGLTWHFIPPGAPNFGGIWEAGVKSMKYHLRRIIQGTSLTFEEFYTVLKQTEACLKSRPISAVSDDPQDLSALTPGHFLIGRAITALPEENLRNESIGLLKRWKLIKQMHQNFWHRWSSEYLHSLQTRNKWRIQEPNVIIGQLVLVRDERLPPATWVLGRIVDTHAGQDGVVRVVTLRTKTNLIKRPLSKISVLPIDGVPITTEEYKTTA